MTEWVKMIQLVNYCLVVLLLELNFVIGQTCWHLPDVQLLNGTLYNLVTIKNYANPVYIIVNKYCE